VKNRSLIPVLVIFLFLVTSCSNWSTCINPPEERLIRDSRPENNPVITWLIIPERGELSLTERLITIRFDEDYGVVYSEANWEVEEELRQDGNMWFRRFCPLPKKGAGFLKFKIDRHLTTTREENWYKPPVPGAKPILVIIETQGRVVTMYLQVGRFPPFYF